jgi:hypothetical protein
MDDKAIATNAATLTLVQRKALAALAVWRAGDAPVALHHLTRYGLKARGFVTGHRPAITDAGRAALALLAEIS